MKRLIVSFVAVFCFALTSSIFAVNSKQVSPIKQSLQSVKRVDLNTASAKDIAGKVKGLGQKRAEAIVNYRTENGRFDSFASLAKVRGISSRFVKKNRASLEKAFVLNK